MLSDNRMKVFRLLCWFIVSVWHPEDVVSFLKELQATHSTAKTVSYRFMLSPMVFFFRWYKWSEGVNAVDSSFDHGGDAVQLHNCSSGRHDWGGFSFSPSHIFCWRLGSNYTMSKGEYFCFQHTGEQYFIVVMLMSLKCLVAVAHLQSWIWFCEWEEGSSCHIILRAQNCGSGDSGFWVVSVVKLRWCSVLIAADHSNINHSGEIVVPNCAEMLQVYKD